MRFNLRGFKFGISLDQRSPHVYTGNTSEGFISHSGLATAPAVAEALLTKRWAALRSLIINTSERSSRWAATPVYFSSARGNRLDLQTAAKVLHKLRAEKTAQRQDIFSFKPPIISSRARQTSGVFNNVYNLAEEELWWVGIRSRNEGEVGWSCINIRSNRGNVTSKMISALRGNKRGFFLYFQVCGPGWVYVLFNIKDCVCATIPNSMWIRRKNKMSSCLLDHIQAGGKQLKGDSKPLPWFHPDKTCFFFVFFKEKATVHDIQWTNKKTQIWQMWHDTSTHPP